ncbi:MAG TPA: SDR family NAD(P)-dependent oxidoreductase [Candidatus Dormibacteraeota bacterium]|nr:SDR family NAD(P)-dependent oxidoreductase [Candidatus Dormibacteraeota bacterium]
MTDLVGRRALVTGASSGIGLATALALARAGAEVHGAARRLQTMERVSLGLFTAHRADVTSPTDMSAVVAKVSAGGPLDVAVFNAGTNVPERRLEQLTSESWNMLLATNLSSAFYGLRSVLPVMRRPGGLAVFVSSVSGAWPDASGPAYQAAKAGVVAMVRAAAAEELDSGVRFTTILPGAVDTPIMDRRPQPPDAAMRRRMLRPEDVAAICVFLAGLPDRVHVPELTVLPAGLQALGRTT